MKRLLHKGFSFQLCALLLIAWCAVILLLCHVFRLGVSGVFSFFYVPVCILAVYSFSKKTQLPKNDSGTIGIFLYCSWIYLLLAVAINSLFLFIGNKQFSPYIVALDIVLLVFYVAVILYGAAYQNQLSERVKRAQNSTVFSSDISREIGKMLSWTNDPEIHTALADLKEMIDYSSDSGNNAADESVLYSKIGKLSAMINGQAEKEDILGIISEISSLWKARNARS